MKFVVRGGGIDVLIHEIRDDDNVRVALDKLALGENSLIALTVESKLKFASALFSKTTAAELKALAIIIIHLCDE